MVNKLEMNLQKLPHELQLKIYEEYLVLYYKDYSKIQYCIDNILVNKLSRENRRALILSSCKKMDIIFNLNEYLKLTPDELLYILKNCHDIYIPYIYGLIKSQFTCNTSLYNISLFNIVALKKCNYVFIVELYKLIDNPTLEERRIALKRYHSDCIANLFELIINPTKEERLLALERCGPYLIRYVYKLIVNPTQEEEEIVKKKQISCYKSTATSISNMSISSFCSDFGN